MCFQFFSSRVGDLNKINQIFIKLNSAWVVFFLIKRHDDDDIYIYIYNFIINNNVIG